jgi:hypothetical protein
MVESHLSCQEFSHPEMRHRGEGIPPDASGHECKPEDEVILQRLEVLEVFVEIRDVSMLLSTLEDWCAIVEKLGKSSFGERLRRVLRFAQDGERIERKYGRNTLLDLEHPVVREWIRVGVISRERYQGIVAAQKRYQLSGIKIADKAR